MIRRPVAWLTVTLLGGALLAGCGGSSTSSSQSSSTPPATTTAATSTAGSTGTTTSAARSPAATQQAIEACKHRVQAATGLPASSKARLEGICAKAASGNTPEVKKAVGELCQEAVNRSGLPKSAKEEALATCRSRTK
jgi:hypothetical protein